MPKNIPPNHKEAFCIQHRKPYSIAGSDGLANLLTLDWRYLGAEF